MGDKTPSSHLSRDPQSNLDNGWKKRKDKNNKSRNKEHVGLNYKILKEIYIKIKHFPSIGFDPSSFIFFISKPFITFKS